MRGSNEVVLAAWSVLLVTGVAGAAQPSRQSEAIAACMVRAAADSGFNGTVYARFGDEVVEKQFGASDAAGHVPILNHTRFNIASAGKMFTAVAIGRLVDRGSVRFDAPIGHYFTDLKPELAVITVAQLLNHTSGLGDYFNPANRAAIDAARSATDLLPLALEAAPAFAAGSRRAYSNSGFVVLGAIIEKVSGLSYAEYVKREILDPVRMSDTRFDARDSAEPMTRMSPQGMLKTAVLSPMGSVRASPAGGMFSTARDLAAFLTALRNGGLVSKQTLNALLEPRPNPDGGSGLYGFGFNVRAQEPRRVGHGGGAPGINAEIALYPESGAQLIALANNDPPGASRMVTVLEKAIFATDAGAACTTALAEGAIQSPTPAMRHD